MGICRLFLKEEEEDKIISLDELGDLETIDSQESFINDDDWSDSYNDMDSEAWDRQYNIHHDEDIEADPWSLA